MSALVPVPFTRQHGAAQDSDRQWFLERAGRKYRIRDLMPGEDGLFEDGRVDPRCKVLVRLVWRNSRDASEQIRFRLPFIADPERDYSGIGDSLAGLIWLEAVSITRSPFTEKFISLYAHRCEVLRREFDDKEPRQ